MSQEIAKFILNMSNFNVKETKENVLPKQKSTVFKSKNTSRNEIKESKNLPTLNTKAGSGYEKNKLPSTKKTSYKTDLSKPIAGCSGQLNDALQGMQLTAQEECGTELAANSSGISTEPATNSSITKNARKRHRRRNDKKFEQLDNIESISPKSHYLENLLHHPLLKGEVKQARSTPTRTVVTNSNKNKENSSFSEYYTKERIEECLKNEPNKYIEGTIRINPKQFQNAYILNPTNGEPDILISGIKNRNRALEGDIVIVELLDAVNLNLSEKSQTDAMDFNIESNNPETKDPENTSKSGTPKGQKTAKVVYIKENVHSRVCIGYLKLMPDKNTQRALFVPRDHRIPRLNIPFTTWPNDFYKNHKQYENVLFSAKILNWVDSRYAVGCITGNLGMSGDLKNETKAILIENNLNISPYGQEYSKFYPDINFTIPEEELLIREDCRKLCVFTIDPATARDLDDAVSCRVLPNGNFEVGVHIADVSYFLQENTILDDKVAEKATTIYMVEKAYHMLPEDLCMLCSLLPGCDKLTFSIFWEIDVDNTILNHRFAKTVINSCCQLSYEHVKKMLESTDEHLEIPHLPKLHGPWTWSDLRQIVNDLGRMSKFFRTKRFATGALRIDQPKLSFTLDTANLPTGFSIYESNESHQLIEEFMLLANMTVAERIYADHPTLAFLRRHSQPKLYMLTELAKSLQTLGITVDISSAGGLQSSIYKHTGPQWPGRELVLSSLCVKPMVRALYFCAANCCDDEFWHYALNVPLYTHFTSPIRRYADIVVHRLLAASIKWSPVPNLESGKVKVIADNCNTQKYNAKRAGEQSMELYLIKYIILNSPVSTEAIVCEVREKCFDVIIIAMGFNRRIYLNKFQGQINYEDNTDANKRMLKLTWPEENGNQCVEQVIKIFSIVRVQMMKTDDILKIETFLERPMIKS